VLSRFGSLAAAVSSSGSADAAAETAALELMRKCTMLFQLEEEVELRTPKPILHEILVT
jgi:hypothetical protein